MVYMCDELFLLNSVCLTN